ncbi:MAG: TIGR02391 family protein [Polaromonas sp.]|nr:TIGR02391 family protein [Polaromonas sp.]
MGMVVRMLTFFDDWHKRELRRRAGIEYGGLAGISASCLNAVRRLLQFGECITEARILTCGRSHCLLLSYDFGQQIAIKSGFASGYGGEGPRTFAEVLLLLDEWGVDVDEYIVSSDVLDRIDYSALTQKDLDDILAAPPVRPQRFHDYIYPFRLILDQQNKFSGWSRFPSVIPFAMVDSRIRDIALKFEHEPDNCLLIGYRRLEDFVRKRTLLDEHGVKLFAQAFVGPQALLVWKATVQAERNGRGGLFTAAYLAYRNRRAHLEPDHDHRSALAEFLLLNHLFLLEGEALEPAKAQQEELLDAERAKEIGALIKSLGT